jgi:hypothetical protein
VSDKTFNIEIIDKDGRSLKVRGIPSDSVKTVKETLRMNALEAEYQPPFHYVTHQMGGTRNGRHRR